MSATNPPPPAGTTGVPPVVSDPAVAGRRGWVSWLWLAAFGGVLAVLAVAEPHGQFYYPRCWLYSTTGLLCPGCGGLRATHAMLNGDLAAAWRLNPLLVLYSPVFGWVALTMVARRFGLRLPNPFAAPWMIGALVGASFVFGILRNLR